MRPPTAAVHLATESFADSPGLDTAVSAALLDAVNDGRVPETLRIYRPGNEVAFGRRDVVSPGYGAAVASARAAGFEAVERLAGGRAAVFTPSTIAFSWTIPDGDPRAHIEERFLEVAGLLRDSLRDIGVDAHIGEVAGEYCPGRFSVNTGHTRKLVGVGQRLKRRAAHVGGVVVVDGATAINAVLLGVYDALGLKWRPEATGAVVDIVTGVTYDDVVSAITDRIARTRDLTATPLPPAVLEQAAADDFIS